MVVTWWCASYRNTLMAVTRLSDDVQYISLHKPLPLVFHGYVWPFILLYAALFVAWIGVYGFLEHTEAFLIGCAIIGGLDIVTCLFCVWSVHVRCSLTCSKVTVRLMNTWKLSS